MREKTEECIKAAEVEADIFIKQLGYKRHALTTKQLIKMSILQGFLKGHLKGFGEGTRFALEETKKTMFGYR